MAQKKWRWKISTKEQGGGRAVVQRQVPTPDHWNKAIRHQSCATHSNQLQHSPRAVLLSSLHSQNWQKHSAIAYCSGNLRAANCCHANCYRAEKHHWVSPHNPSVTQRWSLPQTGRKQGSRGARLTASLYSVSGALQKMAPKPDYPGLSVWWIKAVLMV